MMQKKVCMLGASAVGKTSLVRRYVNSIFSDKYLTTVGVKVDKKLVNADGRDVTLMLWDIYGDDELQTVQPSFLRGTAGYLLVADGTRRATLDTARRLHEMAEKAVGKVPFVLVVNKSDLSSEWQLDSRALFKLADEGWPVVHTSAKTGARVEETFLMLTRAMLGG